MSDLSLELDSLDDGGYRHVLRVALPIILMTSSSMVMTFIDRMFLGWYSSNAMAASMGAGIMAFTIMSFLLGTASYTSTFVAQYYGAEKPEGIGPVVWQGIFFALLSWGLLAGVSVFSAEIMEAAGHARQIAVWEAVYFRILMLGGGFAVLSSAMSGLYIGIGKPAVVAVVAIFCNLVNVVLDYALIFGKWGFPEWGIKGAAVATVSASFVSFVLYCMAVSLGREGRRYHIMKSIAIKPALFRRLLRYGAPCGLQWTVEMLGFAAFVLFVGRLGAEEMQAVSVAFVMDHMAFLPMVGFGIATSVLVGQFLGAGRPESAMRATRCAFRMTFVYMILIATVFVVFPAQLARLFAERGDSTSDFSRVTQMATVFLRFVAFYSLFHATYIIYSSALRGAGDTVFVMLMMFAVSVLLLIVPTYLMVEVLEWSFFRTLFAPTAYMVFLALAFFWRYRTGKWKEMRVIEAPVIPTMPLGDGEVV